MPEPLPEPIPRHRPTRGGTPGSPRPRWWAVAAAWLVPGCLQFVQEATYARAHQLEPFSALESAGRYLPAWLPWAMMTPLVVAATRRLRPGAVGRARSVLGHVALGSLLGAAHLALLGLYYSVWPSSHWPMPPLLQWLKGALWSFQVQGEFLAYGAVVAGTLAMDAQSVARRRAERSSRLEARLAEARLDRLRAQLRPHFLFNALNSVQVLMREDPDVAETTLLRISELLRSSLDSDSMPTVTLDAELQVLEQFLEIESVRFPDRLTVDIQADTDARACMIPTWLLQPLVENALQHGIGPQVDGGTVTVRASRSGDTLEVTVADDGVGIDPRLPAGIGLENTQLRLREHHGTAAEMTLEPGASSGTLVRLRLPAVTGPEPTEAVRRG